jgi:F-type H+-transporting ATPase subunit b
MSTSIKRLAYVALALCAPVLALAQDAHEAAHEAGDAHGGHGGWDSTALTASVVNFAILIALFVYLFKDSLKKFLIERRATVERELLEAARLKAAAEAKHKEYSDRLAQLDQELAQIKSDMQAAGTKERDRIIADAEHKAAQMRKETAFIIDQQIKQVRVELSREAADAAVSAAGELLLRATTTYDQQRLAQEYLTSITDATRGAVAKPKASPSSQPESRV